MGGIPRSLAHHGRIHAAVALGAAVATAVLAGALLVGDSVRGSLRALTLDRLGAIDGALVTGRFFRAELAGDVAAAAPDAVPRLAPAIVVRGSAVHSDSGRRASRVEILGIDDDFTGLWDDGPPAPKFERADGQVFPSVWLNRALADELAAGVGDAVLLRFGRISDIPRDTLMGDSDPEDLLESARLTVRGIVPDEAWGRFGLDASQVAPMNAYVARGRLQRALDREGRVNALFAVFGPGGREPAVEALHDALRPEDLGLRLIPGEGSLTLESAEFVLRPRLEEAARAAAEAIGATSMPVQSYLANALRHDGRTVPYSLVVALDPPEGAEWARLVAADGSPAPPAGDGILVNTWVAEDLGVSAGDTVELDYFEVGPREELIERTQAFEVAGVVRIEGLAADASLTPEYPGIQDAADIAAWDPPFPVDLDRVRPRDEEWWDAYGAVPRAFVSEETGRRLWASRFGAATSLRVGVPDAAGGEAVAERFQAELLRREPPAAFGMDFRAVKERGLEASTGATDFSGLFIGFSLFLIVSAALLTALLFGLGVERRAREIGLLLAVGYRLRSVRRRLLAEGALVAAVGIVLGLVGAVGYAWLMIAGLRTLWRGAVGSSALELHVTVTSLAIGAVASALVVLVSIRLSLRRLKKIPPPALLKGETSAPRRASGGRVARWLGWIGLVGGLALVGLAFASGAENSAGAAFGSAALLLTAGLAFFSLWCRRGGAGSGAAGGRGRAVPSPLIGTAARNSAWNPGRSILCVALVACACFMIVAVGANRAELGSELERKDSGGGGFGLVAESDVPLYQSLDRAGDLTELGFDDDARALVEGATTVPFRLLPGDDASCLNLYRPEKPRILGVPPELVERGGFAFQQHMELPDGETNPWVLLDEQGLDGDGLEPGVVPAIADFNSAMWILHLALGDDLTIENEFGETIRLRLVGLLKGSVFQSEVLIGESAFLHHFPSRGGYRYFLIDAEPAVRPELETALESTLAPFGFDAVTVKQRIESYKVVEHTYLSTFQALGGLGLLLGTVGLAIVMFRNVLERRAELATLRAFGYRRRRLGALVLAENAFLLFVGMGIGAATALVSVAPRLAGIHVPWASLGWTLLVVAAVGMLASLLAVRGALGAPLIPALKVER